jgi:tetratricopeptide (TPR) repeat protein
MTVCSLCRFPQLETELSCVVCGAGHSILIDEEFPGGLAFRLVAEGRFGEAYASLEDLVARGEETAQVCLQLAWLGYALEDPRALETWCHEAERLAPDWAEPHLALAWAFETSGRLNEALEEYGAALKREIAPPARRQWIRERRDAVQQRIPKW